MTASQQNFWSQYRYIIIDPKKLAFLKFIIEGYDNLAYFSIIDKNAAVARYIYSPGQEPQALELLATMAAELDFEIIEADL